MIIISKELEFIKAISKNINIVNICKEVKVCRENVLAGRTTNINEKKVADEIINRINSCLALLGDDINE